MTQARGVRMLGSDAILRCLELEGVEVVFGIPGGAILPTYDAIARGTTVRHVLARHEQGAGHMAEGYARASGKVGVAIATSGPGATNLVTPIADAWMDSTPLVCITGQVRASLIGTDAFQEIDATGITMPIVKHSWLVQDVEELPGRAQGGVPRRADRPARARCSSTSRRTSRRPNSISSIPTMSICPGGSRRTRCIPGSCGKLRRRSPWRSGRSSMRAAASSTPTPATSCSSSWTRRSFPQS